MPYGILENGVIIAQFVVPTKVRNNKPVFVTDTMSLKRSSRKRSAQRWEIETRLDPLQGGAEDLFVNIVSADYTSTVQIITPQNQGAVLRRTSTSNVTATGALGSDTITVANNTGNLAKGSFIRFANHSKVYLLMAHRNGNGDVKIYPELRSAVPEGTTFKHRDDVIMDCQYDTDTFLGMVYEDGILMDNGVIKLIEKV